MTGLIGFLIVCMVIATVLGAVAFIIYLIVRSAYKKKLNKRLQEDNGLIAEGKTPERNRNHIAEPSFMIPLYILLSCLICIVTINFVSIILRLSDTEDEIQKIENKTANIEFQLEDIEDAIAELSSPFRTIEFAPDWSKFDTKTNTVPVVVRITLKTWTDDTILLVEMDDEQIPAVYENGVFCVSLIRDVFDTLPHSFNAIINTNGTYTSAEIDESEFTNIGYMEALGWWDTSFYGGFRLDYNSLKKQYEANEDFEAFVFHYKGGLVDSTIVSAQLAFYVEDELVVKKSFEIPNGTARIENEGFFPISAPANSSIIMEESFTTSLGYTLVYRDTVSDNGNSTVWRYVVSQDGELLYSEIYNN